MPEKQKKSTFANLLNSTFRLYYTEGAEAVEMELVEVTEVGPAGEYQFSLIFVAPESARPHQGLYTVEHEATGALPILLVPIRRDDKGLYYQAIFNNPAMG